MRCLTPLHIHRPGSKRRGDYIDVPCGKCSACLQRHRAEWTTRLVCESVTSKSSLFVTLTYNDNSNTSNVSKVDVQLFLKRLRSYVQPEKLRYYLVSEYGSSTFRPHYHMLLFNFPVGVFDTQDVISKAWGKGFVSIGEVNPRSISYVCKYHIDRFNYPLGKSPTFAMMSTRPFLGSDYLKRITKYALQDVFTGNGVLPSLHIQGSSYTMPPPLS